ncbi:MAG: cupin domain-containing protein [Deltaproteobacteria bacterium]|nr:cupin domain-containing protein [Deltaproteobacteria bacterium]
MIDHHVPDSMLLDHVAGTLPMVADVLVATHLALCPRCRGEVAMMEDAAGAMLADVEPVAADDDALLANLLGRLDDPLPQDTVGPAPFATAPPEALLPKPLRCVVGPSKDLVWSTSLPAVGKRVPLDLDLAGVPATLERVFPGRSVPSHGHEGVELTLVLAGGYTDGPGHFVRGDVQVVGPETVHSLNIDDDGEDCVLLSVRSAGRVPDGLKARIAKWLGAI